VSYDLAVWDSDKVLTDKEAASVYDSLCEGRYPEGESPKIAAFYQDLTGKWPEIDSIPEEKVGDFDFCPWSCALDGLGCR